MSVEALTWAFALALAPAPKVVLLALANSANKSGKCWPGLDIIVEACKPMQLRQVQRHLRTLEELELVKREPRFLPTTGRQISNGYSLAMTTSLGGEGGVSDMVEDTENDRGRVSQLRQGESVTATTSPSSLEPSSEPSSEKKDIPSGKPDGWHALVVEAEEILTYLNELTGRNFRAREGSGRPSVNLEFIIDRLKGGATADQCRAVIRIKVAKWKHDTEKQEYLRPATLFNRTKFEQYIGELADQRQAKQGDVARSRARIDKGLEPVKDYIPTEQERQALLDAVRRKKPSNAEVKTSGKANS